DYNEHHQYPGQEARTTAKHNMRGITVAPKACRPPGTPGGDVLPRQGPPPYQMSRARGSATPIVTMSRAPAAPIDATAHWAPTSAASVPASMLPSVMTTELM